MKELRGKLTVSVPVAGRVVFGLGRDASYAAARRGEIPTVQFGRALRVPTHEALRLVGFSDHQVRETLGLGESQGQTS